MAVEQIDPRSAEHRHPPGRRAVQNPRRLLPASIATVSPAESRFGMRTYAKHRHHA